MKEVVRYQCDKCLAEFNSKEAALRCEKHHTLPKRVFVESNYLSPYDEDGDSGCPETVMVEMEDGRIVKYDFGEVCEGG